MKLNRFDLIAWEGKHNHRVGMIANFLYGGDLLDVRDCYRGALVNPADVLEIVYPASAWNREALRNHLRVLYGLRLTPEELDGYLSAPERPAQAGLLEASADGEEAADGAVFWLAPAARPGESV